jgi:riboflavin kinase / FMN adenylyltransferase
MQFFSELINLKEQDTNLAVALGTFDGVHLGHQSILRRTQELARDAQGKSVVLTFSNHPLSVLAPGTEPLQVGDRRLRRCLLEQMGMDILIELPFTAEFSRVTADGFLQLLYERLAPKFVVVGPDYSFGYQGKGTPAYLQQAGPNYGLHTVICPAVFYGGEAVRSTRIRLLLAAGDLNLVNQLLGRPFTFAGSVVHGDERGRTLGFPTANLVIGEQRAILPNGVYAVQVQWRQRLLAGVASIGSNPTFGGVKRRLEVHLLDFTGDLYGQEIQVRFVARLRAEQKFPSAAALVEQLQADVRRARKILVYKENGL